MDEKINITVDKSSLENFAQFLKEMVVFCNYDLHLTFVNNPFREQFSYQSKKNNDRLLLDDFFVLTRSQKKFLQKLITSSNSENCFKIQLTAVNQDNSISTFEIICPGFIVIDDSIMLLIRKVPENTNRDIEINLNSKNEQQQLGFKTCFLANISHEIRTPMNGILGFAELLKSPNISKEEIAQYVTIIQKSGNRMLNILNDIIDISKIESGQIQITKTVFDIKTIIDELYCFFYPEAFKKNISFSFNTQINEKESIICTDHVKLTQILSNLIKNAIKFTDNGNINFGYEFQEDNILFYVNDSGRGIPSEDLEIIFERFKQIDSNEYSSKEGVGLGLAISKYYVELLGGKIWVESELGKGSSFKFTIPSSVNNSLCKNNSSLPKEIFDLPRDLKILIAEDDLTSMLLLKQMLSNHIFSCNIYQANNGIEAIELVKENKNIDIVLMDLKMPAMDGFEAMKKIKDICPEIPVIAQTAGLISDDQKHLISQGFSDYISKPIRKNELFEKINKHITNW